MFWRYHVNSGQIYVIYALLISIAWLLLNKLSKFNHLASGFIVGITSSLRPPFILLFIPFVIYRQYKFLLGGIIGILFSLSLSLMVVDVSIWKQYILAMSSMTGFVNLNKYLQINEQAVASTDIIYPQIVEGINATITNPLEYNNFWVSSIYDVLYSLEISNKPQILAIGFIIVITFLALYLIKYNFQYKNINFMFLYGTLMCLIGEFFIPVSRYSYYDIQLIVPLFIIITRANIRQLIQNKLIVFLILGLLLSIGCFNWIPKFIIWSTYLITFYITITSLILAKQENET